jgi:DNA-binding transcriptional ArsR family regulator
LITNSTVVQSADFAVDNQSNAVIVWADDIVNSSQTYSDLYYLHFNSTISHTTQILGIKGSLIIWPSVAVDNQSISRLAWTQYTPGTGRASVEYGTLSGNKFASTQLIMFYNDTNPFPPKARLAIDVSSAYVHMAWGESHSGEQLGSTVDYAKLTANGTVVTTLQVAKLDETFHDVSLSVEPSNAGAFVVWQANADSSPYVAQISHAGRLVYLKQLNYATTGGSILAVSTDSENNLYIAWLQPSALNSLSSQTRIPTTKVEYLMMNSAGDIVDTQSQIVRGPMIAVTISDEGSIYAVSTSGFVKIATPQHQSGTVWLAAFALLGCVALFGAFSTEEGRYKLISAYSTTPRISNETSTALHRDVVRLLARRPGLKLTDIRMYTGKSRLALSSLIQMEKKGAICSFRDGLTRRFYARETTERSSNSLSSRILFWIQEHPGIWEAQLAKDLALSQQIAHYHLKRLQALGLVTGTVEPDGKRKLYRFTGTA